jgi:trimeric autotransporter adhesin
MKLSNLSQLGNVGIGTTSPGVKLDVNGTVRGTSAFLSNSDERYKDNIEVISNAMDKVMELEGVYFDWRNDEFPEKNFIARRDMGVIAQNVERYFPEAVIEDSEGFKSVAYAKLISPLIEGTKEQQRQIESNLSMFKVMQGQVLINTREIAELKNTISLQNTKIDNLRSENKSIQFQNELIKKAICEINAGLSICN